MFKLYQTTIIECDLNIKALKTLSGKTTIEQKDFGNILSGFISVLIGTAVLSNAINNSLQALGTSGILENNDLPKQTEKSSVRASFQSSEGLDSRSLSDGGGPRRELLSA